MKFFNSLKFRFTALFTLVIVGFSSVVFFFAVNDCMDASLKGFAREGETIVKKAVRVIDGDAFERLTQTLDENDPFYERTRRELFAVKIDNDCRFLYTMAPAGGTTYRYIIDGSAQPDDTENFSALGDEEDTAAYDNSFEKCWTLKTTQYSRIENIEDWGRTVSIYTPILNSQSVMVGIVGCDFDAELLYRETYERIVRQIIVALVFIAAGIALMIFFMRIVFTPVKVINSSLKKISEGGGDLTGKINSTGNDEIGELGNHVNNTLATIKDLVISIRDQTLALISVGDNLAVTLSETAGAVTAVTGNIRDMEGQVINQSAGVDETSATMLQMTANIDRLNTHVEMQSASVAQSSAAVEEMLANIQSVTQTLVQNAGNVEGLISASEAGRTGLEAVSQDIQEISKESEGLLEINSVMENIASQTNLLSMNAAIEAAHAGEAGKGFAVVAGEIRKLAENSSEQSRIISDVLTKIRASIEKITKSAGTVLEKFQAIDSGVRTVSDQEENIRNAMEEQAQGSRQILDAIGTLNDLSRQVKDGSGQMLNAGKEVILESKKLEEVTLKLKTEVNEITADVDHINTAVGKVNEIADANREHIDVLMARVSKFKVE